MLTSRRSSSPAQRGGSSSTAVLLAGLIVTLLALVAMLAPAEPANAHDRLTGSSPEADSTVEPPEDLVLTFSGQIAEVGAQLEITDPDGRSVIDGEPEVEGTEVTQALIEDLVGGDYAVVWRVTSQDGHPISGEFGFTVEVPEPEPTEEPTQEPTTAPATTAPTTEPTTTAPTTAPSAEPTTDEPDVTTQETAEATDDATAEEEPSDGGLPTWLWVVLGVAVLGLLGLLARTFTRGRE